MKTPRPNAKALNVPSSVCVHAPQAKKLSIKFPTLLQKRYFVCNAPDTYVF